MIKSKFAIFILSNGRANEVKTLKTMRNCNYTGEYYIICDNEDNQIEEYKKNFGENHIIIFDKLKKSKECDTFDNIEKRNTVLFARNSCHEIAKELGLDYFLELDDDYKTFRNRYWNGKILASKKIYCMDDVINEFVDFLEVSGAKSVAFAQTGDLIGGIGSKVMKDKITRKAMNAFFCKTDRPFKFIGRMNDDVNTYVNLGSKGDLFFTTSDIVLDQGLTQQNSGGLTDMYLQMGTYQKSFYTIICNPSSVYISTLGLTCKRIHHLIDWEHTVPKIISDKFRKEE